MKIAAGDDGASLRPQLARHRRRLIQCAAGLFGIVCVVLTASILSSPAVHPAYPVSLDFKPALLPSSQLSKLFTETDRKHVGEIAKLKQLPLPPIQIETLDDDVPASIRRFVGIWVSTKGFVNTGRQFMVAVTHVEKEGLAGGFTVRGPPASNSRIQNPAGAVPFTAVISDNVLTYSNPRGDYRVWFVDNNLVFKQTYVTGDMTMVSLEPIWTLGEAERLARSQHSDR
jgi:hypothetical protein